MSVLDVSRLGKSYGAVDAVDGVDLLVQPGERRAVIGPNGAGKSTLMDLITGWVTPDRGRVLLNGRDVTGRSPHVIARAGAARSFQRTRVFPALEVSHNLFLAAQAHTPGLVRWWGPTRSSVIKNEVERLAEQMQLQDLFGRKASELAFGEARRLEIALALAGSPQLLLLDEPAAGTTPADRERLVEIIRSFPSSMSILLIEHDLDIVFGLCSTITVMSQGRVVEQGLVDHVRSSERVQNVYLGRAHA